MRAFTLYRKNPPAEYREGGYANRPEEPQLQGVEFDDGTVAVRWLTDKRSTSLWADFATFEAVHGHPEYDSAIHWHAIDTPSPRDLRIQACWYPSQPIGHPPGACGRTPDGCVYGECPGRMREPEPEPAYLLRTFAVDSQTWSDYLEVSKAEFMRVEAAAGFVSKFPGEPATSGFSTDTVEGVVWRKDWLKKVGPPRDGEAVWER